MLRLSMNWLDTLLSLPAICKFLQSKEWSYDFPSQYLARGRLLSDAGKVLDIDHFIGSQSGFVGTARVQGTRSQAYKVSLSGKYEFGEWIFWGSCTCPVSEDCKHVAAFVYDLQKAIAGAELEESGLSTHESWLSALSEIALPESPVTVEEPKRRTQALAFLVTPREDGLLQVGFAKIRYPAKGGALVEQPSFEPAGARRAAQYLQEGDRELVHSFQERLPNAPDTDFHWYEVRVLKGPYAANLLPELFRSERLFYEPEIGLKGAALPPALSEGEPIKLGARWEVSESGEAHLIGPVRLEKGQSVEFLRLWLAGPSVDVETAKELSLGMEGRGIPVTVPRPVALEEEILDHRGPSPLLTLAREDLFPNGPELTQAGRLLESIPPLITGQLSFLYGEARVPFHADSSAVTKLAKGGRLLVIERDLEAEAAFQAELEGLGYVLLRDLVDEKMQSPEHLDLFGPNAEFSDWDEMWAHFKIFTQGELEAKGWQLELAESYDLQITTAEEMFTELSEDSGLGIDWFQFDTGIVTTEGQRQSLMKLIANALKTGAEIPDDDTLGDEARVVVTDELGKSFFDLPAKRFFRIVRSVRDLYNRPDDGLHKLQAARLCDELGMDDSQTLADLRALGEQLKKKEPHLLRPLPKAIQAELRDYQKDGFQWLQFLARHHLHGILADDMGLGKTLQTLTHIAAEVESGASAGRPCLVVAPTSVVPNWENEARKFSPSLRVLVLQGGRRRERFREISQSDLVITSFALLQRDEKEHGSHAYHLVILDEAQYIKNGMKIGPLSSL